MGLLFLIRSQSRAVADIFLLRLQPKVSAPSGSTTLLRKLNWLTLFTSVNSVIFACFIIIIFFSSRQRKRAVRSRGRPAGRHAGPGLQLGPGGGQAEEEVEAQGGRAADRGQPEGRGCRGKLVT
jgi:hypothetical protein